MDYLHSGIAGLTTLGVVGLLVWGINSCSVQETALRESCIKSGGSVIAMGENKSHCIRGMAAQPQ